VTHASLIPSAAIEPRNNTQFFVLKRQYLFRFEGFAIQLGSHQRQNPHAAVAAYRPRDAFWDRAFELTDIEEVRKAKRLILVSAARHVDLAEL
jgi:hypothetical protein